MLSCLIASLWGCGQVELRDHLENDGIAPGPVTEVSVENLPGGAKISYRPPADNDLLYVQAEYEIRDGVRQEVRSSYYNNSLNVMGFGQEKTYDVHLYAVDRSGNRSERITVQINPSTPPVLKAYRALDYRGGFGGIHVSSENVDRANLIITTIIKGADGAWRDYDKYYSELPAINFSVRGLDAEPTQFGVYVIDRWENSSDTLIKEITPLYERELDKGQFRELRLANDPVNIWPLTGLWDGVMNNVNQGFSSTSAFPKSFQFSIGEAKVLSRFRIWGTGSQDRHLSASNIREFEVWGGNNPTADGSYDSWTFLGEYEIVKPSGLPEGQLTDEDRAYAAAGFEFEFPAGMEPVSYLRFNILSTFITPRNAATGAAWATEVSIWGQ